MIKLIKEISLNDRGKRKKNSRVLCVGFCHLPFKLCLGSAARRISYQYVTCFYIKTWAYPLIQTISHAADPRSQHKLLLWKWKKAETGTGFGSYGERSRELSKFRYHVYTFPVFTTLKCSVPFDAVGKDQRCSWRRIILSHWHRIYPWMRRMHIIELVMIYCHKNCLSQLPLIWVYQRPSANTEICCLNIHSLFNSLSIDSISLLGIHCINLLLIFLTQKMCAQNLGEDRKCKRASKI